jgi:hypothetical protein
MSQTFSVPESLRLTHLILLRDALNRPCPALDEGWLKREPDIGSPVIVLRLSRGGTDRLGVFTSTAITEIVSADRFKTENSIYEILDVNRSHPEPTSTG